MKKIRINELARELEVKSKEVLDALPDLGITEKYTHSSSLEDDVVYKIRKHFGGDAGEPPPPPAAVETRFEIETRHAPEPEKSATDAPSPEVKPAEKEIAAAEANVMPAPAPVVPPSVPVRPKPIRPPLAGQRIEPTVAPPPP